MKKLFYLLMLIILIPSLVLAQSGVSQPPIWNPHSGYLDFIGPGNGLLPGDTYYLYSNSATNAYYTFDGVNLCLFINDSPEECFGAAGAFLQLEGGTFILLEDGERIILQ